MILFFSLALMTTALKNWEAQAKTNSILAGSLKALEERIDALGIFVEWKDSMDVEVAAMQDTLEGLREAMTAMEKEKKRGKLMGAALAGLSRRNIGGGAQEDTTPTTFMGKLVAQAVSPNVQLRAETESAARSLGVDATAARISAGSANVSKTLLVLGSNSPRVKYGSSVLSRLSRRAVCKPPRSSSVAFRKCVYKSFM